MVNSEINVAEAIRLIGIASDRLVKLQTIVSDFKNKDDSLHERLGLGTSLDVVEATKVMLIRLAISDVITPLNLAYEEFYNRILDDE